MSLERAASNNMRCQSHITTGKVYKRSCWEQAPRLSDSSSMRLMGRSHTGSHACLERNAPGHCPPSAHTGKQGKPQETIAFRHGTMGWVRLISKRRETSRGSPPSPQFLAWRQFPDSSLNRTPSFPESESQRLKGSWNLAGRVPERRELERSTAASPRISVWILRCSCMG